MLVFEIRKVLKTTVESNITVRMLKNMSIEALKYFGEGLFVIHPLFF